METPHDAKYAMKRVALTAAVLATLIVIASAGLLIGFPATVFAQSQSTDATLSALVVSPKNIIGFTAARTSYEVGVAATVTQATIAATANHADATLAYSGTDADVNTDGHQVDLSAGRNQVTITVTAENVSTTKEYTVRVNQGVTTDYGWKASDDLDGLKAAGNTTPYGIWSNRTTMWVADFSDDKIYAYGLSDGARDTTKEFDLHNDNANAQGIWSDGATMWVSDSSDRKFYAYGLSDGARDTTKEFDLDSGNGHSQGVWSDETTIWVADFVDDKLYAYGLSDGARDTTKEFNLDSGNGDPVDIWSDRTTIWVADSTEDKVYAYRLSDGTRDADEEFDLASGNDSPRGTWSDGTTMWVADATEDKVYSYNIPPSDDATLSALVVSPRDIIGFDADRNSYQAGVAATVTQATVTATANHAGAAVAYSGTDADTNTDGHQVDLSAGRNSVTVTVTAQDGNTTETYTVNVNQGVTDSLGWKAESDIDSLKHHEANRPRGVWADSDNVWVLDSQDEKIYGFNRTTQALARTIDLDTSLANYHAIWSDGTHIWASHTASATAGLIAYKLSDGTRAADKDFTTLQDAGNTTPFGIWSDTTTMWIADYGDKKAYAYHLTDNPDTTENEFATHDGAKDINLTGLWDTSELDPAGAWSDGTTVWLAAAPPSEPTTLHVMAYRVSDRTHEPSLDFDIVSSGNTNPGGIFFDGTTFFISDSTDDKVYAYNMPPLGTDATLSALTVSPKDIIGFDADRASYEVGVASDVTQATVTATANHDDATVSYSGTDADVNTDGHQVDLSAGRNSVTVTVTAEDGTTQDYTVRVNRGVTDDYGWKAVDDLDGLKAAGVQDPTGIWGNGTTFWVADSDEDKIYAFNADGTRDTTKDFDTLIAAGNTIPNGIWSDGTTMWVADDGDDMIYAYRMVDQARDSSKDFDTLSAAGNVDPAGIWSDGTTMWVADSIDTKLYAYRMSDKSRDAAKGFDHLNAAGNSDPYGIWSNDTTMWVSDFDGGKLYAYRMSDKSRHAAKDFNTLNAAGNTRPLCIWSDETTMWVADWDNSKFYSYNNFQLSSEARVGAITVNGKSILIYDTDIWGYYLFETGVASDVTTATVTVTPRDSAASRAFDTPDADTNTPGQQLNLSPGVNTLRFTITAEGQTTQQYTLRVNRAVTTAYGWKADEDILDLLYHGVDEIFGIWSDGATTWITNATDAHIYAFNADGTPNPDKDIAPRAGNEHPLGIWSDGTTMWVVDIGDAKIYAYNLADGARKGSQDFNTLKAAGNTRPEGIWSDGVTMWVAGDKVRAYSLADKSRTPEHDFNHLPGNNDPRGIWSDGITAWIAQTNGNMIPAYRLWDKARDNTKDIDISDISVFAYPNNGLWGNGDALWFTNGHGQKARAFNLPESGNAELSIIYVNPGKRVFFTPEATIHQVAVASNVARTTVTVTAHRDASVNYSPADADTATPGHQVDLNAGRNTVTITVTAEDGNTTKSHTLQINRGVTDDFGWKASDDLDGLIAAGNTLAIGVWGNDTTTWVSDADDNKIYAYNADGTRDADQDFDTLVAAGNTNPYGIWSDGTTMWVADSTGGKIYAYRMSDKARDSAKDFDTLDVAGNDLPYGIWSDSTTMWVADSTGGKIYAYRMSDKARDSAKDFDTLADAGNIDPFGIWSDSTTMWVADANDDKIYAYRMSDKARDSGKDFDTLDAAGNGFPTGIWSDGTTMWVADWDDNKLYSYNMQLTSDDATLSALVVSPKDIIGFTAARTSYEVGVTSTVTVATIAATANHAAATVAIAPADADATTDGHQVDLVAGRNEVTVTVTAEDGTTQDYTVSVNRGVTDTYGWKAADDLDKLDAAGLLIPAGIWHNDTTMWISDFAGGKLYAFNRDGTRDTTKDFNTLADAGNTSPFGIWSDGMTMWVVDNADGKIYAYSMSTKARDTSKDFDTLADAGNIDPFGIWSDGMTMWVADQDDGQLYAYRMSDKARDPAKDFDTLADAGNIEISGIWSDGTTMWVADSSDDKIYAYLTSDKSRDATKDFDTLVNVGNNHPYGIWSDGTTMWVVDWDNRKVYSYNMPLGPPANLHAEAGDTRVTLTWKQSRNSNITGYQYRVSNDGGNTWDPDWSAIPGSSHTTTSFTVRDLPNGFKHQIEARTLAGELQSNAARASVTPNGPPGVPLKPTGLSLYSLDQGLRLRWEHPMQHPRAPITSYDVRHRLYGSSDRWQETTRSDTDLSVVQLVSGLTNRRPYEVQVAAVNRVGRGPWASHSAVPQSRYSSPTNGGNADLDLGHLGVHWTPGDGSTGLHPDTTVVNVIENDCMSTETFEVYWSVPDRAPVEYEAYFGTGGGAGEVTHEYRTERLWADGQEREQKYVHGSVSLHRTSWVIVRVRARYEPEGWSTWSPPAGLDCYDPETQRQHQRQPEQGQHSEPTNTPATGQPAITGNAEVGETLTVSTDQIADVNGIRNAAYSYRWSRYDGTTTTAISGATAKTYTLQSADLDRQVSVTVSFTDDDGFEESLTSNSLYVRPASPLYGGFDSGTVPEAHNGEDAFTVRISFSEEPELSGADVRDHVLTVTNGDVTSASQTTPGENISWTVTVEPDGNADVTVELPPTTDCSDDGAVCTGSGKMLFNGSSVTVAGPASRGVQVENNPATGLPAIAGTAQVGETLTASSSGIADADGLDDATFTYQWLADDADIQGATNATYVLSAADAGKIIKVRVSFTDDAGNEEQLTSAATATVAAANNAATGAPTISGTVRVGFVLTAGTSGIADQDGLDNADFSYQWLADDVAISGATDITHLLKAAHKGKAIRVRVTFTDDAGNEESLTSAATGAVTTSPLTVSAENAAQTHDGQTAFTFDLRFSEEFFVSYKTLRDHAFTVTGGTVEVAKRLDGDSLTPNIRWRITVEPDGNADVTIVLPVTTDCTPDGAICTGDKRKLSNRLELTVSGAGN